MGRSLVLLLAALVLPPAAPALVPGQDDAGSGGDAPDSSGAGLPLAPGTYAGALGGLGGRLGGVRALDGNDWYRFPVDAGDLVTVTLAPADAPAAPVLFEVRRPDGALAAWEETSAAGPRMLDVAADVGGPWALRATLPAGAAAYRFTLAVAPPAGFHAAAAGPGAFALGVTLEAGASFAGEIVVHYATRQAPARSDVLILRAPDQLIYATGLPTSALVQGPDGASARAGEVDVRVRTDQGDGLVQRVVVPGTLHGPGTFHVLVLTHAAEAYAWVRSATVTGEGALLGATLSPLHALQAGDFEATAGAATSNAEATLAGRATVAFHRQPIGTFDCGLGEASACTMTPPGGPTRGVRATYVTSGPAGAWTFTREGANAGWNPFPVFMADVTLPGQ